MVFNLPNRVMNDLMRLKTYLTSIFYLETYNKIGEQRLFEL